MESASDSVINLIDQLSRSLTKTLISAEIKEFSKIRNEFTRSSKDRIWGSLLNKGKTNGKLYEFL